MRKAAYRLFAFAIVLSAAVLYGHGQATTSAVPAGWVVEVESEGKVAARSAPLTAGTTDFHVSGLRRRPDWKSPRSGDPVHAVGFRATLIGDRASVVVSQFTGKRFAEKTKRLAEVTLAKGEGRRVVEMADAGFEAIILKLVPADSAVARVPTIVNPSPAVSATIELTEAASPAFRVRFVNNSAEAVDGIIWRTENAGRARLLGTAANKYDAPLIEPNGTYNLVVRVTLTDDSGTRLFLDAIIFANGSVHGDAAAADGFLRMKAGRRAALAKIVTVFATSEQPDLSLIIAQVAELKNEIPQIDGRATTAEGYAFIQLVDEVVESLKSLSDKIQKNERPERELSEIRSFYQAWYARLLK